MNPIQRRHRRIDTASVITIVATVALFVIAIFEKGLTHELLLEAGVFLISVKLILSSVKTDLVTTEIRDQLEEITRRLPPAQ